MNRDVSEVFPCPKSHPQLQNADGALSLAAAAMATATTAVSTIRRRIFM